MCVIGLCFMATGAMQRDTADVFGVSQSSVQRNVHCFTEPAAGQYDELDWIGFV